MSVSDDMIKNRNAWDKFATEYHDLHNKQLSGDNFIWGYWSIPEEQIGVLGNVKDKKVLELGCGEALQSIAIAKSGGTPVGIDNSAKMLEYARENQAKYDVNFPLLHSSADNLHLKDSEFDIVFCDHGAMSFSKTKETLLEVHRVLKKEGFFVFNIASPFQETCYDINNELVDEKLHQTYFNLGCIEDDGFVYYQHTYGNWIRLFCETGFKIIDLIELRPDDKSQSSYDSKSKLQKWAKRWPAENLWKIQKI